MARTIKSQELARQGKARQRCGALFLVASLLLSGCSAKKATPLDAAAVLKRALAKSMTLRSYHFTSRTQVGSPGTPGRTVNVSGDWRRPNRLSLTIISDGLHQDVIMIGNRIYRRPAGSKVWKSSGPSPDLRNQGMQSTLRTLRRFKDPVSVGDTVLNGTPVRHIRAEYALSAFVGKVASGAGATTDIWIDKKSGYIVRTDIKSDNRSTAIPIDLEIKVSLSRFNQTGRIDPPVTE